MFCEIIEGRGPVGMVAYQDKTVSVFAARDQRPTNLGHMLVVTCDHYRNLYDLPPTLYGAVLATLCRTAEAVQQAFAATGTTIAQNNESPGQDVFHFHLHVMPRFPNDSDLAARSQVVDLATRVAQAEAVGAILGAR